MQIKDVLQKFYQNKENTMDAFIAASVGYFLIRLKNKYTSELTTSVKRLKAYIEKHFIQHKDLQRVLTNINDLTTHTEIGSFDSFILYDGKESKTHDLSLKDSITIIAAAVMDKEAYLEINTDPPEVALRYRVITLFNCINTFRKTSPCSQGKRHNLAFTLNMVYPDTYFVEDIVAFLCHHAVKFYEQIFKEIKPTAQFELLSEAIQAEVDIELDDSGYNAFRLTKKTKLKAHLETMCLQHGLPVKHKDLEKNIKVIIDNLNELAIPMEAHKNTFVYKNILSYNKHNKSHDLVMNSAFHSAKKLLTGCKTFDDKNFTLLDEFFKNYLLFKKVSRFKNMLFIGEDEHELKIIATKLHKALLAYFRNSIQEIYNSKEFEKLRKRFSTLSAVFIKNSEYNFIENFFVFWKTGKHNRHALFARLISPEVKQRVIIDDSSLGMKILHNKEKSNNSEILYISPYEINRVLLHAIIVSPKNWSETYYAYFNKIKQFISNKTLNENNELNLNFKKSYPEALTTQLEFLEEIYLFVQNKTEEYSEHFSSYIPSNLEGISQFPLVQFFNSLLAKLPANDFNETVSKVTFLSEEKAKKALIAMCSNQFNKASWVIINEAQNYPDIFMQLLITEFGNNCLLLNAANDKRFLFAQELLTIASDISTSTLKKLIQLHPPKHKSFLRVLCEKWPLQKLEKVMNLFENKLTFLLATNRHSNTLLHLAIIYNNTELVQFILRLTNQNNIKRLLLTQNKKNMNPLQLAAIKSRSKILKLLLRKIIGQHALINQLFIVESNPTPIYMDFNLEQNELTNFLDVAEVIITYTPNNKVLHKALFTGKMVELFHLATLNGYSSIMDTLIRIANNDNELLGRMLFTENFEKHKVFYLAVRNDSYLTVRTYLHLAKKRAGFHEELFLKNLGKGSTALHIACNHNYVKVATAILRAVENNQTLYKKVIFARNDKKQIPTSVVWTYYEDELIKSMLLSAKSVSTNICKKLIVTTKFSMFNNLFDMAVDSNLHSVISIISPMLVTDEDFCKKVFLSGFKENNSLLQKYVRNNYFPNSKTIDYLINVLKHYPSLCRKIFTAPIQSYYGTTIFRHAVNHNKGPIIHLVLRICSYVTNLLNDVILGPDKNFETPCYHYLDVTTSTMSQLIQFAARKRNSKPLWHMLLRPGEYGTVPLHNAALDNDITLAKIILSKIKSQATCQAMFSQKHIYSKNTPLHTAARMGNGAIVKCMLATLKRYNINLLTVKNQLGSTPFHLAAERGDTETVSVILNFTAENKSLRTMLLCCFNAFKFTPLYLAATNGHVDTVKLILAAANKKLRKHLIKIALATRDRRGESLRDYLTNHEDNRDYADILQFLINFKEQEIADDLNVMKNNLK